MSRGRKFDEIIYQINNKRTFLMHIQCLGQYFTALRKHKYISFSEYRNVLTNNRTDIPACSSFNVSHGGFATGRTCAVLNALLFIQLFSWEIIIMLVFTIFY